MKKQFLLLGSFLFGVLVWGLFPAKSQADIAISGESHNETAYTLTDSQMARMAILELSSNEDPELEATIRDVFET